MGLLDFAPIWAQSYKKKMKLPRNRDIFLTKKFPFISSLPIVKQREVVR